MKGCYAVLWEGDLRLPQATSNHPMISNNNIELVLLDDTNLNPDDLWEVVINGFLKEHLGWGEQVDMGELIRPGDRRSAPIFQILHWKARRRCGFFRRKALAPSRCSWSPVRKIVIKNHLLIGEFIELRTKFRGHRRLYNLVTSTAQDLVKLYLLLRETCTMSSMLIRSRRFCLRLMLFNPNHGVAATY